MNLFLLIALAVAPCLAVGLFVYLKDKYEKEPLKLLAALFAYGFLVTIPVAIIQNILYRFGFGVSELLSPVAAKAFVSAGLVEEGGKLAVLMAFVYRSADFNEPFDGIVYAVMISMGFATAENLLYVIEGGFSVGLVRIFTAIPAHASFGVVMGFYVGRSKFTAPKILFIAAGYAGAVLLHGAYDFFLMMGEYPFLAIGGFFSLALGIVLSFNAMRASNKLSPFRKEVTDS